MPILYMLGKGGISVLQTSIFYFLFHTGKLLAYVYNAWYPWSSVIVKMTSYGQATLTVKKPRSKMAAGTRTHTIIGLGDNKTIAWPVVLTVKDKDPHHTFVYLSIFKLTADSMACIG